MGNAEPKPVVTAERLEAILKDEARQCRRHKTERMVEAEAWENEALQAEQRDWEKYTSLEAVRQFHSCMAQLRGDLPKRQGLEPGAASCVLGLFSSLRFKSLGYTVTDEPGDSNRMRVSVGCPTGGKTRSQVSHNNPIHVKDIHDNTPLHVKDCHDNPLDACFQIEPVDGSLRHP